MRIKKFVGEAFEELTIDEMKMVQGSGDVEADFNYMSLLSQANAAMVVTAPPVLMTLDGRC
ncbi:MAG: lichenicidin A2 family type 2 lantibiotic [Butyrivibrio sp.]|nr:lichenicidin A2 family type 2 lantibiotic [Butyrivibrio sp.]